jgi:predicted GH43/DUF377 family glycosyl hydrolase
VIFPTTPSQRSGIEDLRLVRVVDNDGEVMFHGTYTAFSGQAIRQELLSTPDFRTFDLKPLVGDATASKGMALFPRRIDSRFAMLGREDNENALALGRSQSIERRRKKSCSCPCRRASSKGRAVGTNARDTVDVG